MQNRQHYEEEGLIFVDSSFPTNTRLVIDDTVQITCSHCSYPLTKDQILYLFPGSTEADVTVNGAGEPTVWVYKDHSPLGYIMLADDWGIQIVH